jgi:hypothetical protein
MAINGWNVMDPRRSYPAHPLVDAESAAVLEEAIHSLTMLRSPFFEGDALARLNVLGSLTDQAEALMADAVGQARAQECSWADIAAQLGVSTATARRRYRAYPRRRPPLDID